MKRERPSLDRGGGLRVHPLPYYNTMIAAISHLLVVMTICILTIVKLTSRHIGKAPVVTLCAASNFFKSNFCFWSLLNLQLVETAEVTWMGNKVPLEVS